MRLDNIDSELAELERNRKDTGPWSLMMAEIQRFRSLEDPSLSELHEVVSALVTARYGIDHPVIKERPSRVAGRGCEET